MAIAIHLPCKKSPRYFTDPQEKLHPVATGQRVKLVHRDRRFDANPSSQCDPHEARYYEASLSRSCGLFFSLGQLWPQPLLEISMMILTPSALYQKLFGPTDYRPSNVEDGYLALLLLAANADAPSTDFMVYIRSLTAGKADVAVDRIAAKLNTFYDAAARGQ